MRYAMSCARLAVFLALPAVAFSSTLSFQSHTQNNDPNFGGGAPFYYHADLNHDGREDLVFAYLPEMGSQNTFVVQLATGDGVYATASTYQLPPNTGIEQLVLCDFNNDGAMDIIAVGYDGNFYLYQNNQSGKFTLTKTLAYSSQGSNSTVSATATSGDFNHDSLPDLAFVTAGRLYIWFGDGNGGFKPGPSMGVYGDTPMLGDFDGDGKADLLLHDSVKPDVAYVLYGDGKGNFPQTSTITLTAPAGTPSNETYVLFSVGDANSDGKSDVLATQAAYKHSVFIYYGDSSRKFASHTSIPVSRCVAGSASVADMDGNGYKDLIVREYDCNNTYYGPFYVDVLTRNSNSSYNADQTVYRTQPINGVTYGIPNPPEVIRGNADTKPDLLVMECADDRCDSYTTTTLLNTSAGNFPTCQAPTSSRGINICLPAYGVEASSPVTFAIGASGTTPMRDVEVWVDGKKVAEKIDGFSNYTFLNATVSLSPGSHKVAVYAAGWDQWLVEHSEPLTVK